MLGSVWGRVSAKVGAGTITKGPGLKKRCINQRTLTRETDFKAPNSAELNGPPKLPEWNLAEIWPGSTISGPENTIALPRVLDLPKHSLTCTETRQWDGLHSNPGRIPARPVGAGPVFMAPGRHSSAELKGP